MVLAPLFLAAGAVATSVLNAQGPVRGGRAGPDRLQRRDHRRRAAARAAVRRRRASRSASCSARWATCSSSCRSCAGSARGSRPRVDARRRGGAQDARADGAAGARPRGGPGRVPRHDEPRVDARRRARSRRSTFAFAVLQIPIGVIGVPLGIVLLPSLSREAATGDADAFRRLLVRGAAGCSRSSWSPITAHRVRRRRAT